MTKPTDNMNMANGHLHHILFGGWFAYERNGPLSAAFTVPTTTQDLPGEGKSRTPRGAEEGQEQGLQFVTEGPRTPLPARLQAALRRGYYAAVSFVDYEVGRVLAALDSLGFRDHGWKLGEHGAWSKCSNWELDARVPLIVRAPWLRPMGLAASGWGVRAAAGGAGAGAGAGTGGGGGAAAVPVRRTNAIAELVDLYPTAVALAGLPRVPEEEGLDGVSLMPALLPASTASTGKAVVEGAAAGVDAATDPGRAAFTQYPRCPSRSVLESPSRGWQGNNRPRGEIERMGFSIRTAAHRYTEWRIWDGAGLRGDWSEAGLVARELYDHTGDDGIGPSSFDEHEYRNLAYNPEQQSTVADLAMRLKTGFCSP